jgi:hypothetical protein
MDSAAPGIIQQTGYAHEKARFYFRPCTPTQHNAEGIRPDHRVYRDARRPVPVVFAFDSRAMLTRYEAIYTEGNFSTSGCRSGTDAAFFESLPFEKIYHDSRPADSQRREIIFHRCAEILYDDAVDLADLAEVICRTGPERESLLFNLRKAGIGWEGRIRTALRGERMFFGEWGFIENAAWVGNEIRLTPHAVPDGPYSVRVALWVPKQADPIVDQSETRSRLVEPITVTVPPNVDRIRVECRLQGHVAYNAVLRRQSFFT